MNRSIGTSRLLAGILMLAACSTWAHDSHHGLTNDPAALFEHLIYDHGYQLDEVRDFVEIEFDDPEIAADIAAFICAPDPDPECQDTDVWNMWDYFLHYLSQDYSLEQVYDALAEEDVDLADAIVIYWCSPPAGVGCEEESYDRASEFSGEQYATVSQPKSRPQNHQLGRQGFLSGSKRDAVNRGVRRGRD